ncbi:MAG: hypothetical protein CMG24_04830 [Candidatus Marinimicrobia bacterium]|jgi:TetR/AcrR family transcriptional regulator|nr:hypothetical protein [Candidatus Neomarinimicrobiota bacterium]|tara:strand:- start:1092 stop:1679 length:588 start_codon:yes stop_codon:yes gene_type:complete
MVSDRKKEERILRKKLIIDSALSVFNKLGIDKTTMSEIASEAGFGKATLYYYYPSKDDVYSEIMVTGWKLLWVEVEDLILNDSPPKKKLFQILDQICHVVKSDNNLFKFLFTAPSHIQEIKEHPWKTYQVRLYSILESTIEQGCKEGDFINLNPGVLMKAVGGLFHELLLGKKDSLTEKEFEMMISNLLLSKSSS